MKFNCYYKQTDNGVVTLHGCNTKPDNIPEEDVITYEKYEELRHKFQSAPEDTFESVYYFDWEIESYLPRERTESEKVDWYLMVVQMETVALEDVPTEYRAEVKARLPKTEAEELLEEVSNYDYE